MNKSSNRDSGNWQNCSLISYLTTQPSMSYVDSFNWLGQTLVATFDFSSVRNLKSFESTLLLLILFFVFFTTLSHRQSLCGGFKFHLTSNAWNSRMRWSQRKWNLFSKSHTRESKIDEIQTFRRLRIEFLSKCREFMSRAIDDKLR